MESESRILLVEDETEQRTLIAGILRRAGYRVDEARDGSQALDQIEQQLPDVIVSDWRMPGMTGGELLAEVRRRGVPAAFIVMTAYGSIEHAVEAVRMGADDYVPKPFERETLCLAVRRAVRTRSLERENSQLREQIAELDRFGEIIGRSKPMQTLYRTVGKVAGTEATVLLCGESGTGKELVARTVHARSHRGHGPFVAVNCAAIPETLIESELFGHERGAFTGAHRRRDGRFGEADGGTLLLDEIAAMPMALQAKLLRVLQERCYTPLGSDGERECDVRVVAATNRDLGEMVRSGEFREDLYYRLNVVPIVIPPLRERREDIPILVEAFVDRASRRHGITVQPLPASVMRVLLDHTWPGNVRELANVVERLVLLCEDGKISTADLPEEFGQTVADTRCPFRLPATGIDWEAMEEGLLRQALELSSGNRTAAARALGLGYKAFLYRLEKHGISDAAS